MMYLLTLGCYMGLHMIATVGNLQVAMIKHRWGLLMNLVTACSYHKVSLPVAHAVHRTVEHLPVSMCC